jgi:pimeloyl-ACP methyl ester carboxylesterase
MEVFMKVIKWLSAISVTGILAACASTDSQNIENRSAGDPVIHDIEVANEGRQIPATLVLPSGSGPFPLVVMEHGFAGSRQENGGFAKLADALARAGIATIRMDFPGCGDSKTSFSEYSLSANNSDAEACRKWAVENAPVDSKRIGIFGYSNGGRQALMVAVSGSNPYKAMGLLAPAYFTTQNEKQSGTFSIDETKARLAEAQSKGAYQMDWFGRTLSVSAKNYQDDLDSVAIMDSITPALVKTPSLVVYGSKDETVLPAISQAAASAIGAKTVEVEGADHGYGFYSDQSDVTAAVEGAFVEFFKKEL